MDICLYLLIVHLSGTDANVQVNRLIEQSQGRQTMLLDASGRIDTDNLILHTIDDYNRSIEILGI